MVGYIIQRLLAVALILVAVSVLVFGITMVLPGNVAYIILGQLASPEQIHALEVKLGLLDPIPVQYWHWASHILIGDLGNSTLMDRPIAPILMEAIGRSAMLALTAFVLIAVMGIALGVVTALRQGRTFDYLASSASYLGISVPEFFWSIIVIMFFASYMGWLPASGYEPITNGFSNWLLHIAGPVITLVIGHIAHVSRLTRSSMIEVMQSTYVRAARAKGLPERIVVLRHALRNALLPSITVLAIDFGRLMGGLVVIETVFAYPGLGRLVIYSIQQRDIPTLQASVLVVTAIYALANLAADLVCAWLNPRIRYG